MPWLEWSFDKCPDKSVIVSNLMNIFGIILFLSVLISPLPGLVVSIIRKYFECSQDESEKHGLNFMLFFSVFLNVSLSLQMCITGSYWNAILIFLEFAILRTIFFVTRSMVSFSLKFKSYLVTKRFFKKYLDLFCNIIRFGFSFFTSTFLVINLVFFLLCAWYR